MALPSSGKPYTELPDVEEFADDDEIFMINNGYGEKAKFSTFVDEVHSMGTGTNMISDAFDEEMSYSAGEYCIYDNSLYKFTKAKEAGEWDDNVVEITTVSGEIQENTDLIDSLANIKMYNSLDQIGLSVSDVTSLPVITSAMKSNSILYLAVNSTNCEELYANEIIPINTTGILEIAYISRVRFIFNTDKGAMYLCSASNGTTATPTNWEQFTLT